MRLLSKLLGSEYTLVQLVVDASASSAAHQHDMERLIKEIVRSCSESNRKNNLMLRVVAIRERPVEVHDFKPLVDCDPAAYDSVLLPGGLTALYDATHDGIKSLAGFGRCLAQEDCTANGILVVMTDGLDNHSAVVPAQVSNALGQAGRDGTLESLTSVLVGIVGVADRESAAYQEVSASLRTIRSQISFTKYMELAVLDDRAVLSLTEYICTSILAAAHALGSACPPVLPTPSSGGEMRAMPSIRRKSGMAKKKAGKDFGVEAAYPNIAQWVQGGWIEIGDQDWRGFAARAFDEGGMIYEKEGRRTLIEAMEALEVGLGKWLDKNGRQGPMPQQPTVFRRQMGKPRKKK